MSKSFSEIPFKIAVMAADRADEKSPVVESSPFMVVRKVLKSELLVPMTNPTLSKPTVHSSVLGEPELKFVPTYCSGAKP